MEILLQLNRGDGGGVFAMEGEAGGMIDRFWFFLCFSDPRAMEGRWLILRGGMGNERVGMTNSLDFCLGLLSPDPWA